ncbi:hypothetical protein V8C42DRAFT_362088 [Trichoderma barbatum]
MSPEEQHTVNSRRIRSRIAQQAYRKRHKEKFDSSQKRAQDLQAAAQRACNVFTNLTSVLIQSGVIQRNSALTTEVVNAIKEFHYVAKVVDEDRQCAGFVDMDQLPQDIQGVTTSPRSDDQTQSTIMNIVQLDLELDKSSPNVSGAAASNHDKLDKLVYSRPLNDQILVSPSYFALESAMNGEPSSIGSRLLSTTLSSGYEALKGNYGHTTELGLRIFGLTLSFRNRNDVLSEFQWWLGPGQPLASRLKQARHYPGVPTSERYLSVEDVVTMLQDVGLVNAQDDILEFSNSSKVFDDTKPDAVLNPLTECGYGALNTDTYTSQSYSPSHSKSVWRSQPALRAFDFNSLVGNLVEQEEYGGKSHPVPKENMRASVPISVLLQSLANISVCLSIGPGYPQQAVKSLIYEALSGIAIQ